MKQIVLFSLGLVLMVLPLRGEDISFPSREQWASTSKEIKSLAGGDSPEGTTLLSHLKKKIF
ncbi:MAG: hypothetical protein HYT77_05415 [Deltaproteobacteria bacterium]|nr:hypothetical protein [Deltaproteobacteria bacterium]